LNFGEDAQEVRLAIVGMSADACADRIRDALMKEDGVLSARVVYSDSAAIVRFNKED
jgi:copper chaperone CopZ